MKLLLIITCFFISFSGFCQDKKDSIPVSSSNVDDASKKINAADSMFSSFVISALIPYNNNYFKNGQYLFDKWVKGTVTTSSNLLVKNNIFFFNYDKVAQNLYLTTDLKQVIKINTKDFKAFSLGDEETEYDFERVPLIDKHQFFQALIKGDKYCLYKEILTRYRRKEEYTKTGDFVDFYRYYIVFPGGKLYKQAELTKKSITAILAEQKNKTDKYFADHHDEEVDEDFLTALISYLNVQ
jgi:hypothetical protein